MNEPVPPKGGRVEVYTHEPMVNWLQPSQLLQTGLRAAVATTIGAFADPREVQAALRPKDADAPIVIDLSDSLWLDYAADLGDGWHATHSVAWCLSREARSGDTVLPRPQVLVLGGDQVYPTPANGGYRTRFVDPFRSAFPAAVPAAAVDTDKPVLHADSPLMLATPGNHDWYDGLRAFSQLFCNRQPIGGWRTQQQGSYFVAKLPHGWWVWGLDLQLESEMDRPQREYFQARARDLQPGDRVVLCAPEPSWIEESERVKRSDEALAAIEVQAPRFRSLKEIEELLGPKLALVLAGDLHHYAHYQPREPGSPERITCGGGGAYLLGTHMLPKELDFFVGGKRQTYVQKALYPEEAVSKKLRNGAWRLPTKNVAFCALLAGLYLLFTWMLQSASKMAIRAPGDVSLMEGLSALAPTWDGICAALKQVLVVAAHSPSSSVFAFLIVVGTALFSQSGAKRARGGALAVGAVHGVLHLLLAIAMLWALGWLHIKYWGLQIDAVPQVLLFIVETFVFGGLLGGLLFGCWIVAMNAAFRLHGEEVFSSQRIDDYRCFLRMRFDADGLTVFPMKIEKVCRRWKLGDGIELLRHKGKQWKLRAFPGSGPRFVPDGAQPVAQALEAPIRIPRNAGSRP
jgi:hypothetical protein